MNIIDFKSDRYSCNIIKGKLSGNYRAGFISKSLSALRAALGVLILLIGINDTGLSQNQPAINTWSMYPSYNKVNDLSISASGELWAATNGGLFAVQDTQVTRTVTVMDGLYRTDIRKMAYDAANNSLILGFIDGHIDVYDVETSEFARINDIQRVEQYTSKQINELLVHSGNLYVATDFGVVNFNLSTYLVENSYTKMGAFTRGTSINDLEIRGDSIYCATDQGLAVANLNDDLLIQDNWRTVGSENNFEGSPLLKIVYFNEQIFISTENNNYNSSSNGWEVNNYFGSAPIQNYSVTGDGSRVAGVSQSRIKILDSDFNQDNYRLNDYSFTDLEWDAAGESADLWVGTEINGMGLFSLNSGNLETYKPGGPYINFFEQLTVDRDGNLVAGTVGQAPPNRNRGYHIFMDGSWKSFYYNKDAALRNPSFIQAFRTTATDEYFYIGSWGRGIAKHHKETDSIRVYKEQNSNLSGLTTSPSYIISTGLDVDSDGRVWTSIYSEETALYYQQPGEDDWTNVARPQAAQSGDLFFEMFIDSFDQKWIPLVNTAQNGRGLLVLRTNDLDTDSDDRAVRLTDDPNNGNLPNNKVNDIEEDNEGNIYVATGRGVARFSLPTRIIGGNSADRRAQWLINADTAAASPFLLRDINATTLTVNEANQKWIGSESNGLWLINAEGNRILEHFTTENSPLISNNIISTDIDNRTGTLFIATDKGLVSYTGVPKEPVESMDELFVYPNPYSYSKNTDEIIIENLSEATKVQILGVDGRVVNTLNARGGRISWDARSYRGKKVATGIYIAVAVDSENNHTATGKILIVQ